MRQAARLAAYLLCAAPLAAEPFEHTSGEWRQYFRDWLAVCPNTVDEDATDYYGRACFASTGSQELNSTNLPSYKLTLIRDRLSGDLDIAITVAADEGSYDETQALALAFSGEETVSLSMGEELETRSNVTNQYFVTDEELRDRLFESMRERTSLRLFVPLEGAEEQADIRLSLQGVMASLDFMSTYARRVAQY
ncbi:hypothetical protein SAMN05216456_2405 [Devosia crocina]|uniref:Invasion protein IalB, involved in pathogenesis n=1 Tax=Devosia crocina TaxID=429728 RepID=A0A1I7NNN9_9HYPH|nr:hypothetical protein [Devosia crocina]SFV36266.1 hypothetical protein SAMN05216456_2405 [Devosia crocina]